MTVRDVKAGVNTGLLGARFCFPAIVSAVDYDAQTLQAKIAIQQIVDGENVDFPVLVDVPFVIPTCQGYSITLPIQVNDEVLIVFADRCIDDWFINGSIRPQLIHRVHDISDGFAILGVNSVPNVITSYSPSSLVIRTANNAVKIELTPDVIKATDINIDGDLDVTGDITANNVTATGDVIAAGVSLVNHIHTDSQSGSTTPPL